jgi:hypothetical protein
LKTRHLISTLLVLLGLGNSVHGQSPFDYGKSKEVYFFSATQITKHKIGHIFTIVKSPEQGYWDFFDIDFTDNQRKFYNKWNQFKGDSNKIPQLDSLISEAGEAYGSATYYTFRQGKIDQVGQAGHGAVCYWIYKFYKGYSISDEGCKYSKESNAKKIVYRPKGLINYTVCCRKLDSDNKIIDYPKNVFKDTTFYIYNSKGKILGFKTKKRQANYNPIFSNLTRQHSEENIQTFINQTPFEQYIDQLIGYRPSLVLFEIYKNAVLPFQYDAKQRRYIEMRDIHLE